MSSFTDRVKQNGGGHKQPFVNINNDFFFKDMDRRHEIVKEVFRLHTTRFAHLRLPSRQNKKKKKKKKMPGPSITFDENCLGECFSWNFVSFRTVPFLER